MNRLIIGSTVVICLPIGIYPTLTGRNGLYGFIYLIISYSIRCIEQRYGGGSGCLDSTRRSPARSPRWLVRPPTFCYTWQICSMTWWLICQRNCGSLLCEVACHVAIVKWRKNEVADVYNDVSLQTPLFCYKSQIISWISFLSQRGRIIRDYIVTSRSL